MELGQKIADALADVDLGLHVRGEGRESIVLRMDRLSGQRLLELLATIRKERDGEQSTSAARLPIG